MYILNKRSNNNYNVELVRFDLETKKPFIKTVKTEQTFRDAKRFAREGNATRVHVPIVINRHELVEIMGYLADIQVIAPEAMDIFREWDINEDQG